ncbi:MAG: hypothetical protein CK550_05295 [Gemmatimonadetes bacterium]|nr:MAG: hypothetical protein CK550_05295 [Gemmatimonadota bacterium]
MGGPLYDMPADRLNVSTRLMGEHPRMGSYFWGLGSQMVRRQDGVPAGTVYTLPTAGDALVQLEAGTAALAIGARRLDVALSINNALKTRYRDYLSR